MSTRGSVAIGAPTNWRGVYNHKPRQKILTCAFGAQAAACALSGTDLP